MRHSRRFGSLVSIALATGAAALGLAACGSSAAKTPKGPVTHLRGGVAVFAEAPQSPPDFIFPFSPLAYFSVTSLSQFQELMFRPLYWFGQDGQPTLTQALSLAQEPVYSDGGKVVTISMKGWKWSNGETVNAQDVLFWMNMVKTEPENWAGFSPGEYPQNVLDVTAPNSSTVVFTLDKGYSSTWFTYNELSQITPMPMAWDITASSGKANSGGCAMASYKSIVIASASAKNAYAPISPSAKACDAVYRFLAGQAGYNPANPQKANGELSSYDSNPLWQIVDGPWRLKYFDAGGKVIMVPNPYYSGLPKPSLKEFVELPFQSSLRTVQRHAHQSGRRGGRAFRGHHRRRSQPARGRAEQPEARRSSYNLVPVYGWAINYFPYNFNSNGDGGQAGKIFSQLYFRQAFQSLVDQPLYIKEFFKNYAVPTYGPVPVLPKNPYADSFEQSNPYPYNPGYAKHLLVSNGWNVVPGGTSTCADAAKCGVPVGSKLDFTLNYVSGSQTENELMQSEQSSWAQVGIHITLTQANFPQVIGAAVPCTASQSACGWELENWGAGWIFAPDYYPTGDEIFSTGAGSNSGSYSSPVNDSNTLATYLSNSGSAFKTYQDYLAKNLPVVWQPNAGTTTEIAKNLAGATPQNPLFNITPEYWYFTSNPRQTVP